MEHLTYIHWFLTEEADQTAEVEVLPAVDQAAPLLESVPVEYTESSFEEDRDRLAQMYPTLYF